MSALAGTARALCAAARAGAGLAARRAPAGLGGAAARAAPLSIMSDLKRRPSLKAAAAAAAADAAAAAAASGGAPAPAPPALAGATAAAADSSPGGDALALSPRSPPPPAGGDASAGSALSTADAPDGGLSPAARAVTAAVLRELSSRGAVARATLAAVEATREWSEYEAEVQFATGMVRVQYAATPGAPMTSARRSQAQAHARSTAAAVMDAHADAAARRFVAGITPGEAAELRAMLTRLDAPRAGGGGGGGGGEGEEELDIGDVPTLDGQGLKEALWEVSHALAHADPELREAIGMKPGAPPPRRPRPAGAGARGVPPEPEAPLRGAAAAGGGGAGKAPKPPTA